MLSPRHSRTLIASLIGAMLLTACGGSDDNTTTTGPSTQPLAVPAAPKDLGFVDSAPVADQTAVLPFVDFAYTNQRGDARYATKDTNAGVRVLGGFLDLWQPRSLIVDAGTTAPASGSFPAVVASDWTGVPNDATDGTIRNAAVLAANIDYVATVTAQRTTAQALAAYLDDRRGKAYSVTDGMGPLTTAWRTAAQQTTTITDIPADATTVLYNDGGNNIGVAGSANTAFGTVVDFVNNIGENGSTEPAKRFFKYARPWRWSASVQVVPALEPAKSPTPATDGGYTSGHTAEAVRDAIAMAYVVPERFQEMVARGLELGENRIVAGMHSPLDVVSGRMLGQATAAASIATGNNAARKAAAYAQARSTLMAAANVTTDAAFRDFAHSGSASTDRFAEYATNKANYLRRMTFGFAPIADTTRPAVVPKGAEVLLETRLPYLDAAQRRVVLKTTAVTSGYPVMDDAEGWGRLNLFAAADGYGAFRGDVVVNMDASRGGFHALDTWRNDIGGDGKLAKQGTGTLRMGGQNTYTGGTQVTAGMLQAVSATAFGKGEVYLAGGTLASSADAQLVIAGAFTQLADTTLQLDIGSGGAGRLAVSGIATVAGGTLAVNFRNGFRPSVGDTIALLNCGSLRGRFTTISVPGYKTTAVYTETGLSIRLDGTA